MPSSSLINLAGRIKALRVARGLTQAELAERCGYEPLTVSRFERGTYSPGIDTLITIAKILDVPVQEFFSSDSTEEITIQKLRHEIIDLAYSTDDAAVLTLAASVLRKNS
ncbi:helix-turn-helix transcriptional regulator [Pseudomonas entomophila]|uniref:helix-turn-helix domain-containing protein n=1 Tax=Pseudomonas entomophila TaxID=312306 RepID=UPI0023D84C3E|nr:helix-turn-helix transcriptional regulator [Pseudomonas entomophila]MDF0730191.1 helix-turn-helix transcriptional regulator [Pseudomonas entomophila]